MCFSATASFSTSAVLGVVGVATVMHVRHAKELPLALTPLIFAAQQAIEGFLWLSLPQQTGLTLPLTYFFLFFALLWWPVYAPLAILWLEDIPWRKMMIALFAALGMVAGLFQYGIFLARPKAAEIINACIYYPNNQSYHYAVIIFYALATVGAGLISSKRIVNVFALLTGLFAIIAWYFYTVDFASVWCYFAALASVILYLNFASLPAKRVTPFAS